MLRAVKWMLLLTLVSSLDCGSTYEAFLDPDMGAFPMPDLPPVRFSTRTCASAEGATAVAVANLDRDTRPDIVVSNSQDSTLTVYLNQGMADCPAAKTYLTGRSPSALSVGDVSGDGFADIVVATGGDNTVSVHRGNGDGTLLPASTYQVPTASSLALGDIDGKNGLDVVALSSTENAARVLFNQGGGMLSLDPTQYFAGRLLFSLALAPLQTSALDLILASAGDDRIGILSEGRKLWTSVQQLQPAGLITPVAVMAADLNADGRLDLIVPSHNNDLVLVLLNQGSYKFASRNIAVGHHPLAVAVADLTHDERPDVVVLNAGENTLQVIVNLGRDAFATSPLLKFQTGEQPVALAAGDLNADGAADLVVVHRSASMLTVLGTR